MSDDAITSKNGTSTTKNVMVGLIIGGIIGAMLGYGHQAGIIGIPVVFAWSPFTALTTGTVLGVLLGALVGNSISDDISVESVEISDVEGSMSQTSGEPNSPNAGRLLLREEQLDVFKSWVQTGVVTLHTEIIEEEQTVTVPVKRQELVIEKEENDNRETIRIPVREERVEISKYPVTLEDISVYKRKYQEIKHIEEYLKKEKLDVGISGKVKITQGKRDS